MIGFPPRYSTEFSLENRSSAEHLRIIKIAMQQLGWEIGEITSNSITAFTKFSLRSWSEQVSAVYTEYGDVSLFSVSTGAQILDFGRNRQNVKRLIRQIDLVNEEITEEALIAEDVTLEETHHLGQHSRVVEGTFGAFRPVRGYYITPIIIAINVIFYLLLALVTLFGEGSWWAIHPDLLEKYGANFKEVTLFGEPWRLIAYAFLHADVLHLFFNMYGLMICGLYLEPVLGKWRYLMVYLLCCMMSALGTLFWLDITPSIGASGGLFGLTGFIFVLLLRNFVTPGERKALLISIGIYIAFGLSSILYSSHVDHAAHITGLLTGMLIALIMYPGVLHPAKRIKTALIAGFTVCTIIISTYFLLPRDVTVYINKVEQLGYNFTMAQGSYSSGTEKAREKWLRNFGIYYMDENLRIMDQIDELQLGHDSRKRNKVLRKLFLTQRNIFAYSYKTLREGRNIYDQQIINLLHETNRLRKELNW